jgi:hypothetical protein
MQRAGWPTLLLEDRVVAAAALVGRAVAYALDLFVGALACLGHLTRRRRQ